MVNVFIRWSFVTLVSVYVLILIGGIVRATGSGMGCPDWPKCFGSWVPPTEVSQLPSDYREHYVELRKAKNIRVSKMVAAIGWNTMATALLNDPSVYKDEPFNAVKTWIEYINRVIGALIGLFIMITAFFGFRLRHRLPSVWRLSWISVILVLFQGWLGSVVVSANLMPFLVTLHMALAILMVWLLILAWQQAIRYRDSDNSSDWLSIPAKYKSWISVLLVLTFVQVLIGTQVREQVDDVFATIGYENREGIVDTLGTLFYVHRSSAWLLLAMSVWFAYRFRSQGYGMNQLANINLALIVFEALAGVVLAKLDLPAYAQPIHLTMATLAIGWQYYWLTWKVKVPSAIELKS